MAWMIEVDRTGETCQWTADGELVMSEPERWEDWQELRMFADGGAMWSPTGPLIKLPPNGETETFAAVQLYLSDMEPDDETATVTGDTPDVSSLWLAPGETEGDRVY